MTTVVVLGTGEMGSRVCRLLKRWAPGVVIVGVNRRGTGPRDSDVRAANVLDPKSLRPVLAGATLAVNAVGPYDWDPAPLVAACVEARCHYADLAEDLSFLARVERTARTVGAHEAAVTLVPGCSTVPGLVQVLASGWGDRRDVAQLSAWLSLGSRNPPSRGLLAGMLRPIGRPMPEGGRAFRRLERFDLNDGRRLVFGSVPAPFPSPGVRVGGRSLPLRFRVGFDRRLLNRTLSALAPWIGRLRERSVPRLAAAAVPLARLAWPFGTTRGALAVVAEDAEGRERARVEVRAHANGLDVPALPPVWLARSLRAKRPIPPGVVALDDIVCRTEAIDWLREAGYEVVES